MLAINQLIGFGANLVVLAAGANLVYVGNSTGTPTAGVYTATGASLTNWSNAPAGAGRLVCVALRSQRLFAYFKTKAVSCGGVALKRWFPDSLYVNGGVISGVEYWYGLVPSGSAPDTVVTTTGDGVDVGVYALYNQSETPLDQVQFLAASGTAIVLSDVETQVGGVVLGVADGQTATPTYTQTWSSSESVVEDFEGTGYSSNSRSVIAHLESTTALTTSDLTFTASASVSGVGAAISFGPSVSAPTNTSSYWHSLSRGDRTSTITITTTATLGGGTINNLIDGGFTDNTTDSCYFNNGQSTREIVADFGASKVFGGFRWYQGTATSHGTWVCETSPDNAVWTQQGDSFTLGAVALGPFSLFREVTCRYVRLRQTAGTTSSGPWLREIEFQVADTGAAARRAHEAGDRYTLITATTTATLAGGLIENLFDNLFGLNVVSACYFTGGQSTKEVVFDFGASIASPVIGLRWIQDILASHGSWDIKLSTDNISYGAAVATVTLGGSPITEATWANSTTYRYLKLEQVSGTTHASPYLIETEFKFG